ncbi:glycoside hydrolase family protein [Planctomicrobium piriforme]|uniref:Glycosyl hydrolases family 39 n=1 Tax=Planctomicrobium piriforme TaxID=1576369 RepID=A0A1I3SQA4_9PLAN|nr:hypothetical protein [Planctomicrobium piriforme]SFJ60382.1 Glycosyl hydrolases family 39 [Planctomicrobium piriforme]
MFKRLLGTILIGAFGSLTWLLVAPTSLSQDAKPPKRSMAPFDRSLFDRKDLVFGSEIGAWDQDGGTALKNPQDRSHIRDARIRIIRWGLWAKFEYMQEGGSTPRQTLARFNEVVDGIADVGAIPCIKLPPIWPKQGDAAIDAWNIGWLKEIVKNAGKRVPLYEFANEPDWYQKWDAATYSAHWKRVVPELKKYARSQGFEIFVGGPAMANSYPQNVAYLEEFLKQTAAAYRESGNRDVVPDFVSSHTYLTEKENSTPASMLARIDAWGNFYDQVRRAIDSAYQGLNDPSGKPLAPQIKIADSEFNYTINNKNTLAEDQAYADAYVQAMYRMLRRHDVWMANIFTIASHKGGALDLLNADGSPKPLYKSFKAVSLSDPFNAPRVQK